MLFVDNLCNIHITRGDTGKILLGLSTGPKACSADYVFSPTDKLNFCVYGVNERVPLFVIEFTNSDIVTINEDTEHQYILITLERDITRLPFREYQYDIKLYSIAEDNSIKVDTVVTRSMLYIED